MMTALDRTVIALSQSNFGRIRELVDSQGLAFFDGFEDTTQLLALATYLGQIFRHRDSDELGITHVKSAAMPQASGFYGFTNKGLPFHTDRSTVPDPPNVLILACKQESSVGGETILADGKSILCELTADAPTVEHPLIDKQAVIFDDSKDCFKGNIFTKEGDGSYTLRYRRDDFAYFSSPVIKELAKFDALADKHSFCVKLHAGDGYVINNRWWLHGRKEFSGEREFLRLLVSDRSLSNKGIVLQG